MKDIICLAIESSCDETSVAIIKNGVQQLSNVILSQIDVHASYGGVVPEIASRKHIENITIVIEEALNRADIKIENIDFIAVTYTPGLIGALLVGVMAAKTLAFVHNKPIVPVHHIAGHIYANNLIERLKFPLIGLVVSGGHTELVLMEKDYSFKVIGSTLDDAVGEAYDKVGRILNLEYPAGPKIDKLAGLGTDTYNLPTPLDDETYNFSFSGLKSAVINLKHNEEQRGKTIDKENLATSFQNTVINILIKKTMKALKEYNVENLIVAGGVAANDGLREKLKKECEIRNIKLILPEKRNCTDNAAMIGAAGYYAYMNHRATDLNFKAKANEELV